MVITVHRNFIDGKFIFFDRRNGERIYGQKKVDIYWVDAQIIETLRPKP